MCSEFSYFSKFRAPRSRWAILDIAFGINSRFTLFVTKDQHLAIDIDGVFIEDTGSTVPPVEWVPIAITITNYNISFYVNKLKTGEAKIPIVPTHAKYSLFCLVLTRPRKFHLGCSSSLKHFFWGALDEVKLWSIARTRVEFDRGRADTISAYPPLTRLRC